MSVIRKSIALLEKEGWYSFLARATGKLTTRLFRTNAAIWCCSDVSREPARVSSGAVGRVRFDATETVRHWLLELRDAFPWVYVERELDAASRHAHIYVLLESKGVKAGYVKVGFSRVFIGDYDREIDIPPKTAFIYDVLVLPEFRSRGMATHMITSVQGFLRRRGFRWVWCHIPLWNKASIKACGRCGLSRRAYIRFIKLARWAFLSRDVERMMRRNEERGNTR